MSKNTKLSILKELEGFDDLWEFLEHCSMDSVCPAICTNRNCDYTCEMEPDQDAGYCEECDSNTMKSALILAGLI